MKRLWLTKISGYYCSHFLRNGSDKKSCCAILTDDLYDCVFVSHIQLTYSRSALMFQAGIKIAIARIMLAGSALIVPAESFALDAGALYKCVSTIAVSYYRPDDKVNIKRGEDAECMVHINPSKKTWSTNCLFAQVLDNYDEVEVLSSDDGRGNSKIMVVAMNRKTAVIKTVNIWESKNSPDLEFTLTVGSNANHGTCTVE